MRHPQGEYPDLKPCPFCKGEAEYKTSISGEWVECKECKASTGYLAINSHLAWNNRATGENQ